MISGFLANKAHYFGYDEFPALFLGEEVVNFVKGESNLSRKMKDLYYFPCRKEGYLSCKGLASFLSLRRVSEVLSVE